MAEKLRQYAHAKGQNVYHLIWCTKYRLPLFKIFRARKVCEGLLRIIAQRYGMIIKALRVLADHVHAFVELKPSMSPSKAVALLKGISSRSIRKHFKYCRRIKALWSPGKFYRSVGSVTAQTVEYYIKKSTRNNPYKEQDLKQTKLLNY